MTIGFGHVFAHNLKVVEGSATLGAQLVAGTDLPASGSYVDISDAIRVHILCKFGAVDNSDTPVLEPKVADAADGTLDVIDSNLQHTAAGTDDQERVVWTIETESLATDHHFLALDVVSGVINGSYAQVEFWLEMSDLPVTQTTSVLPTASQYWYAGGKSQAD